MIFTYKGTKYLWDYQLFYKLFLIPNWGLSLYRYLYVLAILGIEISQITHTSSIPFWTYRVGLHFLIASISRIDIYPSTLLLCSLMRYRSETWLSVYRFHSVVYRNLKWDFYDHLRSDNFCIVVNNHFTLQS